MRVREFEQFREAFVDHLARRAGRHDRGQPLDVEPVPELHGVHPERRDRDQERDREAVDRDERDGGGVAGMAIGGVGREGEGRCRARDEDGREE